MRTRKLQVFIIIIISISAIFLLYMAAQRTEELNKSEGNKNVFSKKKDSIKKNEIKLEEYGICAAHPLAVEAGMKILRQGGNAVDAAVATAFALAVVEPYGSGLGGGGLMLIDPNDGRTPVVFNYREQFPLSGKMPQSETGIPGMVYGMSEVAREYGTMDLKQLMEPAYTLANDGFRADRLLHERLSSMMWRLPIKELPSFFPGGKPVREGNLVVQKELAETLNMIREYGIEPFYYGKIADDIANRIDGIEVADLKSYSVRQEEPIKGTYRGYDILTTPSPSSGITLIQSLKLIELMNIDKLDDGDTLKYHLISEITKETYNSRASKIGDPKFVDVDTAALVSDAYIAKLEKNIFADKINKENMTNESITEDEEHSNTTHFVTVDKNGMMVSATHSLGNFFGSGIYIDGFFMNEQLSNFSQTPNSVNYPAPRKQPRTFLCPTIVELDGMPIIGIGTPGGRRIPIMMAEVLSDIIRYWGAFNDDFIQKSINKPRFFGELGKMYMEKGISSKVRNELEKKYGYDVVEYSSNSFYGGVNCLAVDYKTKCVYGGADYRRDCKIKTETVK